MTYPQSQSRSQKWLIPLAAIAGLLLIIFYALGLIGGEAKIAPGSTPSEGHALQDGVQTFTVNKQAADNTLSWQGTVRSRVIAKIAPKLNARILEIRVHPGDHLNKGDIIALLDDRDLRAATNAANAA